MIHKRKREDGNGGKGGDIDFHPTPKFLIFKRKPTSATKYGGMFKCTTCNKEFSTFQALGGHRTSHRNPKSISDKAVLGPIVGRFHECDTCGEKFLSGQALGGHMTKHRNVDNEKTKRQENILPCKENSVCASDSSPIYWENLGGYDESRCHSSKLVTRDLFPMEPMWVNAEPVKIMPALENFWLELKLGLPC